LHGFRKLLAWRRGQELLIDGEIEFLAATESVLAFRRFDDRGSMLAAFNLSAQVATLPLPQIQVTRSIGGHGLPEGSFASATLTLPGHGVAFFQLAAR
jgi:alpha-glucosidase